MASIRDAIDNDDLQSIKNTDRIRKIADKVYELSNKKYSQTMTNSRYKETVIDNLKNKIKDIYNNNIKSIKTIEYNAFDISDYDLEEFFNKELEHNENSLHDKLLSLLDKFYQLDIKISNVEIKKDIINYLENLYYSFIQNIKPYGINVELVDSLENIVLDNYSRNTIFFLKESNEDFNNSYSEWVYDYDNEQWIKIARDTFDYDSLIEDINRLLVELNNDILDKNYNLQNKNLYTNNDYVIDINNDLDIFYNDTKTNIQLEVRSYRQNDNYSDGKLIIKEKYPEQYNASVIYDTDLNYLYVKTDVSDVIIKSQIKYILDEKSNSIFYTYNLYNNSLVINDIITNKSISIYPDTYNYITTYKNSFNIYYYEQNEEEIFKENYAKIYQHENIDNSECVEFLSNKQTVYEDDELVELFFNNNDRGSISINTLDNNSLGYNMDCDISKSKGNIPNSVENRLHSFTYDNGKTYYNLENSEHGLISKELDTKESNLLDNITLPNEIIIKDSIFKCEYNTINTTKVFDNKFFYSTDYVTDYIDLNITTETDYKAKVLNRIYGNWVESNVNVSISNVIENNNYSYNVLSPRYNNIYIRNNEYLSIDTIKFEQDIYELHIEKSNVSQIIYGEYKDWIRYERDYNGIENTIENNLDLYINGVKVNIIDGYFEYIFDPTDTLVFRCKKGIELSNIKVENYNGITDYNFEKCFLDYSDIYKKTKNKNILQGYLNTDKDIVKLNDKQLKFGDYIFTMNDFVDDINGYLTDLSFICQKVNSIDYSDNTLTIDLHNFNDFDYLSIDNDTVKLIDNSVISNENLYLDKSIVKKECIIETDKLIDSTIKIHVPNKLEYHNKIGYLIDETNTDKRYDLYQLYVGEYYENDIDEKQYLLTDIYVKNYKPNIVSYSEKYVGNELNGIFKTVTFNTIDNQKIDYNVYNATLVGNYPLVTKTESLTGYNIQTEEMPKVKLSEYFSGKYLSKEQTNLSIYNDMAFSIIVFVSYKTKYDNETITEFMSLLPGQSKTLNNVYGYVWYIYKYGEMESYKQVESESWKIIA